VAIAAALVPPIATVGICLSLGEVATARGAALLFGTNVVAIVIGAAANFFLAGIRGRSAGGLWAQRLFIVFALTCAGLAVPLTSVLIGNVTEPRMMERSLSEVAEKSGYRLIRLRKSRPGGAKLIDLEIAGPEAPSAGLIEAFRKAAEGQSGSAFRRSLGVLRLPEVGTTYP
jgi:hypothetical protein